MKNWKTTIGGLLTAIGLSVGASEDPKCHLIGTIVAGIGALIIGGAAKDKNVTGGTTPQ